jgi:CBS domain-containing protein
MEVMTGNGPFLQLVDLNKCVVSEGYMKPHSFVCCSLFFLLLTDKRIRHVPVFDDKVVGMISIGDVVRTIVDQQHQEVKQLKKYIRGDYY